MPVVELDTIKASDAFGSGSSPDGHTIYVGGEYFFSVPLFRYPSGRPK